MVSPANQKHNAAAEKHGPLPVFLPEFIYGIIMYPEKINKILIQLSYDYFG